MMRLGTRISSVDPPMDSFSQRKNKTFPEVCSEDTWQNLETFIVFKAEEGGVIDIYCVEARDAAKHNAQDSPQQRTTQPKMSRLRNPCLFGKKKEKS